MNKYFNSYTDLEHLELVARRIHESGTDITSSYHQWIDVAFACASQGEAGREPFHTICSVYPGYKREECDEKFTNCLHTGRGDITLATLFKLAKDNGIDTSLPRGCRPKTEEQKEERQKNKMLRMHEAISQMCQTRFNTWTGHVELFDGVGGLSLANKWKELDDRDLSTIFCRLKEQGITVSEAEVKAFLQSIDNSKDYDPVRHYLESLPPYDPQEGIDDIDEFFAGHLVFDDEEDKALCLKMLKKWFVCLVALALGKLEENPLMPTLCGPQHIGKTFFIRHILPPELRTFFKAPTPSDPVDKDYLLALSQFMLIFLDEFSISSDMRSNAYKAIITSGKSNLRASYDHFSKERPRRASLIAATNYQQFIREAEGNRRYLGIRLKGTVNLNEHPLNYERAYAQALYLLQQGYDPKPTAEESRLISDHNREFMEPNDCETALMVFLRKPQPKEPCEAWTASDIFQELTNRGFRGRNFSPVEIGRRMGKLGFEKRNTKTGVRYLVSIADYDRQKRERLEETTETSDAPF